MFYDSLILCLAHLVGQVTICHKAQYSRLGQGLFPACLAPLCLPV